ncbi:MAG: hypothetical protein KJP08_04580 [Gammaproteobacteria bacterium]|nr:hypothetical protein [Gammaproteobacteria bacterium]MBT8094064.1 hypothetical protein [Gammaproteobacteria bacterium]MBT8105723.1 hypothetical protein [Gammaproteobacteria bacterium]NNK25737.1 hypothetical protein [Woeseiaceae bacterium]NNL63144.1 hypothetical protein [Woeseiaceae bacterium]
MKFQEITAIVLVALCMYSSTALAKLEARTDVSARRANAPASYHHAVIPTRLAAFEQNVESGNRAREALITNPAVGELFLKGLADYRNLPPRVRCIGRSSNQGVRIAKPLLNAVSIVAKNGSQWRSVAFRNTPTKAFR